MLGNLEINAEVFASVYMDIEYRKTWDSYVKGTIIQGVHKVFRQFKNFIAKSVDEIFYMDLFYINQCLLKFLVKLKFCVSD